MTSVVVLSASIARASLSAVLKKIGQLVQRPVSDVYSTTLVAIILLSCKPEWIADLGFILSFSCTYALIIFKYEPDKVTAVTSIREALYTSALCTMVSIPILCYTFGTININGLINTPLISIFILPFSLLGIAVYCGAYCISFVWWEAARTVLFLFFYLPLDMLKKVLYLLENISFLQWQADDGTSRLLYSFTALCCFASLVYLQVRKKSSQKRQVV